MTHRTSLAAVVLGGLLAAAGAARAEPPSESFAIEGGAGLGVVTHGRTFAAFELVERIHLGYRHSTGLQVGLALQHAGALAGDADHSAELFFLGAEARYHPFADACVDPWLGFAAGFGTLDEEGDSPVRREQWNGPTFQLTLGVLFAVTHQLAVGAWAGVTFGLWEQTCVLSNPYQLEHCIGHGSPRIYGLGVSLAPRFTAPQPPREPAR
jgi:hypothetical protein